MTLPTLQGILLGAALLGATAASGQTLVPESSVRTRGLSHRAHTNHIYFLGAWNQSHLGAVPKVSGSIKGYYPSDVRAAYNLPSTGGSGTIAIVDAFDLPTSLKDFNTFAAQFGLPQETSTSATASTNKVFQVAYAAGSKPRADASWGGEIALDVEWAHAMAPNAKIVLIECASDNLDDLQVGVQKAAQFSEAREVSMSFGADEYASELSEDATYTTTNVVYFSAAGDTANELDYPAASPNVVAVGGTSLQVTTGTFVSERAWADGGGGPSPYEPLPAYQSGFTTGNRATPDVSAVSDPATGCAFYDSTPYKGRSGWQVVGGTSLATPIVAGITNLRGGFSTSSYAEHQRLYSLAGTGYFRDVVSGSAGDYSAAPGYDFVTGLGSPLGVFPTTSVAPDGFSVTSGTPVGGVPGNVAALDNKAYTLRSVATGATQQSVVATGSFATTLATGATRLGANLSLTGLTSGGAVTVSLYNFTTAAWDAITTRTLGATNTTVGIPFAGLSDYFDAGGAVRFMLTSRITGSSPAVFKLGLDQIRLSVATTG